MNDSKNPSSDPSSQGASSESQIDLSQLDPLHTSTTVTPQSTSSNLIDLLGDMSLSPVLPSPDPVPLLNPIITDEPLAHLYITGIDTYATVEEFENDTVLKRYKKFCSNLRMQTSTVSGKKRIIISFHNRDAVMEAESDLRKSFPGENVNFKIEYIEQEEPTTLKQEPGPPTQKEREVTQTEAKPREPIPPATARKSISTELMIFIRTNFKSDLEKFKLQGTVMYDEDKGTVTITHPDPQELQRFDANVFNEIDEVLENLNEGEMKLLNSPVQNYSSCIELICQTETNQIQYLMNSNPNQIHIFGDKLLVSKAMKKLKQTLNTQLAISRNAVIEAESDSQRSFPGENLDFKTDYIEREEPTTLKEEPGSPLTQTEAKPAEPIPPTTASKNISTELMIFIRTNFKSDLKKFKLHGTVTCDEGEKTVTITHPDPQELQRFERNVFNEVDEVLENLTEEEMKLLKSPVQNYSSCIDIICQTESNQIQYLMNSNPNQIHIFGDKLLVSKAMKKLKQTLSAQLAISRPLVFFFKSFPSVLHPNTNLFHISDLTVTIKGTSSVEQCKEIRDSMLQVVSSCCVKPLKISQKLLRPAHVFITRNYLCVCLLIQTQEGEFLDKADRAIPGGSIYVCGLREHIDPLIPVLENPIEESVSISQKALTKLTKTTDNEGTNLLEKIKAKSKVSISLDEQTVITTGFIHDDINATVEELKKNFEDVNIVLDECYLDPLQKSYLLDQRTKFKSQIIQKLELTFQLKVEVQGSQICLSGDQDSFRNLEANPRKLAEFFEHRIPIRTVCKEVEERSAQLFARLIFRYLGDLSSQEHFFVFLIDQKRMQMTIRPGFCEIPILIIAADSIIVSIESKIKELRPKCEIVKLKREDLNLVSRDASNKIKQIEASEYLRIIPDSQECKLQVFSIGLSSRTAQKMIDFALSDQYYSRHLPITPMLAFYIQEKKLINIFTKKWQCHMKIIEVKENEEFITHCQIDGKRESLEKLANHIITMDKDLTSKSVEVNFPAKKFCSQFHAEILEVLTSIKGDSNIVIDVRSIAGKDPTFIGKAKVHFISTSNSDINDLSSRFSDLIKFSQTTPLTLLPAQHANLVSDMLPTLTNLSLNRHYYIVLNRENVFIKAINHFANTALPCGEYDLQPYLEISSCEYRADNLAIFNLPNNQSSREKLNALGVGNSVNIIPPASLEQPFKLEGKHVNVQTVLAELMKLLILAQDQRLEPTPKHWDPQAANEMCKLVRLQPTQPEYLKVVKPFQSTLPKAAIVRIERIQNTWLWTRYQQDKQRIVQKCPTGANELILFHGTRNTDPISVYKGAQGFDFRFSSSGMWGNANYFAVNASYSNGYAHPLGDGSKQMFSVRICAGDVIDLPSDRKLRLPPPKPQTPQVILPTPKALTPQAAVAPQFANDPFDTVSGDTGGSKVYMIYENCRAYPEYLITYR